MKSPRTRASAPASRRARSPVCAAYSRTVEVHVRTPLIFPDDREAFAELLRGLGYEPSTEEVPRFSLEDASDPRLTPREKDVLGLMAQGYTYWEIAATLKVATGTVRIQGRESSKSLHWMSSSTCWQRMTCPLVEIVVGEAGRTYTSPLTTSGDISERSPAQGSSLCSWTQDRLRTSTTTNLGSWPPSTASPSGSNPLGRPIDQLVRGTRSPTVRPHPVPLPGAPMGWEEMTFELAGAQDVCEVIWWAKLAWTRSTTPASSGGRSVTR